MSRGGRRRKSRRRGPAPARSQSASPSDAPSKKDRAGAQNNSGVEVSVVEQMRTNTKRLQTFPADEVELDGLIADLQSEYGIPPTPQEYRLVIRTSSAEPEAAADSTTSAAQETSDATPPGGIPISTTGRRRRRRRSTSASGLTDDATDAEPDQSTSL